MALQSLRQDPQGPERPASNLNGQILREGAAPSFAVSEISRAFGLLLHERHIFGVRDHSCLQAFPHLQIAVLLPTWVTKDKPPIKRY